MDAQARSGAIERYFRAGATSNVDGRHSSQVGKERLLLIVGVDLDDLPAPGESLTFEKLKVLAVVPVCRGRKKMSHENI